MVTAHILAEQLVRPTIQSCWQLTTEWCAGLEEGRPDGTEEQQLPELERLIEQESAKAKHEKGRNGQVGFLRCRTLIQ